MRHAYRMLLFMGTMLIAIGLAANSAFAFSDLEVTPTTLLEATGPEGGPFLPERKTYTIRNSASATSPLNWDIVIGTGTNNWLTATSTSGTLAPGASTTVDLVIDQTVAAGLQPNFYNLQFLVRNLDNSLDSQFIGAVVEVKSNSADLVVIEPDDLNTSGPQGGPFSPSGRRYTLRNSGAIDLNWRASDNAIWTTISPQTGTLAPGAQTTVRVSVNTLAGSLPVGTANGTLRFENLALARDREDRDLSLTVVKQAEILIEEYAPLEASGAVGGPFFPVATSFFVKNVGDVDLRWSGFANVNWLTVLTQDGGAVVPPGERVRTRFVINDKANQLAEGDYTGIVTLRNQTTNTNVFDLIVKISVENAQPTSIVSAVLPGARATRNGVPVTAFATLINTGTEKAFGCRLAAPTGFPGELNFTATNAQNTPLPDARNAPITINPGEAQSMVFEVTPNTDFQLRELELDFDCDNTSAAAVVSGLNTFFLNSRAFGAPVDIITIGSTPTNDGILRVPGSAGVAAFSVAAINIGANGFVSVRPNKGAQSLPLQLTICQTNPADGTCLSAPSAGINNVRADQNVVLTFAVFAQSTGAIPFNPAQNRIFVDFNTKISGSTTVAVTTE